MSIDTIFTPYTDLYSNPDLRQSRIENVVLDDYLRTHPFSLLTNARAKMRYAGVPMEIINAYENRMLNAIRSGTADPIAVTRAYIGDSLVDNGDDA